MKQLAKEYYISLKLLNKRICELQKKRSEIELNRAKFASASRNIKNEGKLAEIKAELMDYDGKIAIFKGRIKILVNMKFDLVDVAREVYHYYDPGWYRSPDYSMNKRRGQKFVYDR